MFSDVLKVGSYDENCCISQYKILYWGTGRSTGKKYEISQLYTGILSHEKKACQASLVDTGTAMFEDISLQNQL